MLALFNLQAQILPIFLALDIGLPFADDVLRDLYVRGKYRDVILPMTVLRRLDSLLELSQPAVLEMKTSLDNAKIIHQDQALRTRAPSASTQALV